jgi:hypothetical protein
MAEEWAEQLGKVRLWLQEQLLAQGRELLDVQKQKATALAELAAVRAQCDAAQAALARKQEEVVQTHTRLYEIEQSRSMRMLQWMRGKLLPPQSLRGRLARKSMRASFHLLRPGS